MAISEFASGTVTVSTTELSLISGTSSLQASTTAGVYQLLLDLSAVAAGDQFRLRIKEKVLSGGTQRYIMDLYFAPGGASLDSPIYASASLILKNGWDMTLIKVLGTDRAIPYSIRQVA